MILKQTIKKIKDNPRKLFLIDGVGALVSAFMLGVVLVRLEHIFGVPVQTLYLLAFLPVLFAVYDFYSYREGKDKLGVLLKGIAIMNIGYCLLSIGLAFYHHEVISYLGWAYIVIEIMIVVVIAILELKVAKNTGLQETV